MPANLLLDDAHQGMHTAFGSNLSLGPTHQATWVDRTNYDQPNDVQHVYEIQHNVSAHHSIIIMNNIHICTLYINQYTHNVVYQVY
jgi:hypothetical protein